MNFENHLKINQWLKIYFFIQFTAIIFSIVVFVQKKLIFTFFLFLKYNNKTSGSVKKMVMAHQEFVMALPGVCHGSVRSPSWLCSLQGVLHGSARNSSGWENARRSKSQVPQETDSSQSHERFLPEPCKISPRAMTDSSQVLFSEPKSSKTS